MRMKRVCHFTSVHKSLDDRIFEKECVSLAKAGYEVTIVAGGDSFTRDGVTIVGCGESKNHLDRFLFLSRRVYKEALKLDCDIYHFHDPELLPYGLLLKKKGKKVIFDSHEYTPGQILDKKWIPGPLRRIVSEAYKRYETRVVGKIDGVITATPFIAEQFAQRARRAVDIRNYPILDDIENGDKPVSKRDNVACYAGGINEGRGEKVMLEAMKSVDGRLLLAGNREAHTVDNVEYLGWCGRDKVNEIYGKSVVGLVVLKPLHNYIDSLPIKMFEYMAAGIPFIASDFPLWREIVTEGNCGFCVNPENPDEVAEKINMLFQNKEMAEKMGCLGRKLVHEKYNWNVQAEKMLRLYNSL